MSLFTPLTALGSASLTPLTALSPASLAFNLEKGAKISKQEDAIIREEEESGTCIRRDEDKHSNHLNCKPIDRQCAMINDLPIENCMI